MKPRRVAIVTGAGRGIGREMAEELLRRDYRVAALDLSVEGLAEPPRPPDQLVALRCDVRRDEDVVTAVGAVVARWGRVDVLVNNAAVVPFAALTETSLDDIRSAFEVNVFGVVRTTAAVLPVMRAQGSGTIANVTSVLGFTGMPLLPAYSSTKAAVEALTRSLGLELAGSGIGVKLLHAPLTRTPASAPLGAPGWVLADPARVGRRLAAGIDTRPTVVTADLRTAAWLAAARLAPGAVGRLQARALRWFAAGHRSGNANRR